jgi:hypothetical protein
MHTIWNRTRLVRATVASVMWIQPHLYNIHPCGNSLRELIVNTILAVLHNDDSLQHVPYDMQH